MIKTTFRKLGLASCMVLTLVGTIPATVVSALAQTSTINTGQTPGFNVQSFLSNPSSISSGNIGSNVQTLVSGGINPNTIASALKTSVPGLSTSSTSSLTGIIQNISSGNITPTSAISLVNGLTGGQLSTQLTSALSKIPGLGNITSVSGITSALQSSAVSNALKSMGLSGTIPTAGALDTALKSITGGNFSQAASALGASAIANTIAQISPQLAQALGGVTGLTAAISGLFGGTSSITGALGGGGSCTDSSCTSGICSSGCTTIITQDHEKVRAEIKSEFEIHRTWILTTFWKENVLPALMLMAEQLSVAGIMQVEMIGAMLDAKHQLETQRVFQQMTAQAHKDYQPSEGMCTFGTSVRSLVGSERRANLAQTTLSQRMLQRQAMSGEGISVESADSDIRSRLTTYISTYCDQADDANGMKALCKSAVPKAERRNIDVDYTRNIESRLTLDTDFTDTGSATEDEQDVFALGANLYAHNIPPRIAPELFGDGQGKIRMSVAEKYMDLRAIFAKRSVAQNSFAAITAQRAAGSPESAPYTKAIIKELGVTDTNEIDKLLGKNPSYFAQMEILTKKLYQNPTFYTELYDKPVNIERKGAALQAIGLMQDRDLYNSLIRSEAVLSVLLETMLQKEQEKEVNAMGKLNPTGGSR